VIIGSRSSSVIIVRLRSSGTTERREDLRAAWSSRPREAGALDRHAFARCSGVLASGGDIAKRTDRQGFEPTAVIISGVWRGGERGCTAAPVFIAIQQARSARARSEAGLTP
jgi:hypothetical protein